MNHPVFILEGPDSAGKTTLARAIRREVEARGGKLCYIHLTLRKEMALWQWAALQRAHRMRKTHVIVLDRHWISEQVYGSVYRDQVVTDRFAWPILAATVALGVMNVMCVPTLDNAKFFFTQTEGREMYPNDDNVLRVAQAYRDITYGAKFDHVFADHSLGARIADRLRGLIGLHQLSVYTYSREPSDTLAVADFHAKRLIVLGKIAPRKGVRDLEFDLFGKSK
jgi:predicted ATPase